MSWSFLQRTPKAQVRKRGVLFFLGIYRYIVSPFIHLLAGPGFGCRYQPTCSEYFAAAVTRFGFFRGGFIGTKRLCSCHPWSSRWKSCGGWDPL